MGSEAPSVELRDTDGIKRTIADLRGEKKGLLLFFCNTRRIFANSDDHPCLDGLLSDMQEHFEQFDNAGFAIVAVINDTVEENKTQKISINWITHYFLIITCVRDRKRHRKNSYELADSRNVFLTI
ncbi:MAG: redoxin domain-containing protein [Gammaproteobacteria bacterium]|nr:redoxin domain-containing protein [Gammaproteobacteria bacterium]MYF53018.1 redoxin domain-containing protein [Gammaproteobacteria bacterium]MYK44311.1 redoxin domain-containing protein [Gammaproteobacteria bacterium]